MYALFVLLIIVQNVSKNVEPQAMIPIIRSLAKVTKHVAAFMKKVDVSSVEQKLSSNKLKEYVKLKHITY